MAGTTKTGTAESRTTTTSSAFDQARRRARYWSGLVWHAGAFLIINAFFWLMDMGLGQSGAQWWYWIAIPWAFALAFHGLAYYVDGRRLEDRAAEKFERQATQDH